MCGPLERVQIFSRRSGLTQTFVESCVDFEVAHLSVLMVWRLAYPEIPTLKMLSRPQKLRSSANAPKVCEVL